MKFDTIFTTKKFVGIVAHSAAVILRASFDSPSAQLPLACLRLLRTLAAAAPSLVTAAAPPSLILQLMSQPTLRGAAIDLLDMIVTTKAWLEAMRAAGPEKTRRLARAVQGHVDIGERNLAAESSRSDPDPDSEGVRVRRDGLGAFDGARSRMGVGLLAWYLEAQAQAQALDLAAAESESESPISISMT